MTVLVTYASKHGSTRGIAQAIGDRLRGTDSTGGALLEKEQRRLDAVGACDHHVFTGAVDPEKLGLLERRVVKTAKTPVGDFRDWNDVERWADAIAVAD